MKRREKESGRVELADGGTVIYSSRMRGDFTIALSDIRILGELTTPYGPFVDDYYLCLATNANDWREIPFCAEGFEQFIAELQTRMERQFQFKLASSTSFNSNVLWPESLAGEPMFSFHSKNRTGILKYLPSFKVHQSFTPAVLAHLKTADTVTPVEVTHS